MREDAEYSALALCSASSAGLWLLPRASGEKRFSAASNLRRGVGASGIGCAYFRAQPLDTSFPISGWRVNLDHAIESRGSKARGKKHDSRVCCFAVENEHQEEKKVNKWK